MMPMHACPSPLLIPIGFMQILSEEPCQLVPGYHVLLFALPCLFRVTSVVEVAMRGSGYDEQLLVLRMRIGGAYNIVSLSLSVYHIVEGSFAEVARMGFLTMHHEDGRTYLVDIVEETGVGVCLRTYDTPTVV